MSQNDKASQGVASKEPKLVWILGTEYDLHNTKSIQKVWDLIDNAQQNDARAICYALLIAAL